MLYDRLGAHVIQKSIVVPLFFTMTLMVYAMCSRFLCTIRGTIIHSHGYVTTHLLVVERHKKSMFNAKLEAPMIDIVSTMAPYLTYNF